jgi:hypothetical protein
MDPRRIGVLLAVFGLAAVPLLVLGYLTLSLSTTAVQDEAKKGAYITAAVTAVVVTDHLDDSTAALDEFAQSQIAGQLGPSGEPSSFDHLTSELSALPQYYAGWKQAVLADARGVEITDSAGGVPTSTTPVTVTASGSTDTAPGFGGYKYQTSTDNGTTWSALRTGATATVKAVGVTMVRFESIDAYGNTSGWVTDTVTIT